MLLIPLLGMKIFALADAAYRKDAFFVAADKQNKAFWLIILAVFLLLQILIRSPLQMLNLVGTVAACVYLGRRTADSARHAALLSQVPADRRSGRSARGPRHGRRRAGHGLRARAGELDRRDPAVRLGSPRASGSSCTSAATARRTAPETPWTYASLKNDLMAVVTAYGARRALGVSLGAGASAAACESPEAFDRLVLVLPRTLDRPRHDPAIARMQPDGTSWSSSGDLDGARRGARGRPAGRCAESRRRAGLGGAAGATAGRDRLLRTRCCDLPAAATRWTRRRPVGRDAVRCWWWASRATSAHPAALARELAERLPDATASDLRRRRSGLGPSGGAPRAGQHLF